MAVNEVKRARTADSEKRQEEEQVPFWKCLLAEVVGTFFLTFVSAAPIVFDRISAEHLGIVEKVVPAGALVAAMIYTVGPVSGAHFNPVVTMAFSLHKAFPAVKAIPYILAQLAGAFIAATVLLAMFGNIEHLGANVPHGGIMQCFVQEIIYTFLLVSVILGTSQQHKIAGPNAALGVGMTIALCGMVGGVSSGGSMNPARSLAPAILSGFTDGQWLYVIGPIIGSALAVGFTAILHGGPNFDEQKAANGEKRVH